MTEREALLRTILERPDDDLPRLVYADWLEENGEEQEAKRIRWEIANPDHREWVPHYGNHSRRVWIMHNRGFVGGLRTDLGTFMDHSSWFFRQHPITKVVLSGRKPYQWMNHSEWHATLYYRHVVSHTLPPEFFNSGKVCLKFPTSKRAREWASQQAVSYGRKCADLPPLEIASPSHAFR